MFEVNQIFIDDYPAEAAEFCNAAGDLMIVPIDHEDGHERYQIQKLPEPTAEEVRDRHVAEATSLYARITALEECVAALLEGNV